ncbi:MAG: greA [Fibrobacteres bacterium]|nr:greA [Fibrobacterota bacterium]
MNNRIPMTQQAYDRLAGELDNLKKVERPYIIEEISVARAQGDLSENAEYHAAKEKQGQLESKINELEDKIHRAEILSNAPINSDHIIFGNVVSVKNLDTKKVQQYTLVGPEDVDVISGKISSVSPIGKSLMGKKPGDKVEVQIPKGTLKLEILDFK